MLTKSLKILKTKTALFTLSLVAVSLTTLPVKAAEKLFLSYGPLMFSVKVESLEQFAKDGKINKDLEQYLKLINAEQKKDFREILTQKIDLNPVLVSRFLNTAMGEEILQRLGKGITIQGGRNGAYALRGAIVQAAFDPQGLTLLNILKNLPTNMQIQGELLLGAADRGKALVAVTDTIVKKMRQWTEEEAKMSPSPNFADLPDLRKNGSYEVKKEVWNLTDSSRNRSFYVDVYIPQGITSNKIPVVLFSHGLSSRPEDYSEGLNHLASYGYVIAAPQHIGSDIIYLKEMFEGYHKNIFDVNEFINRPKDISFVIDELERRNSSEFQGQLDLKNIGVSGHSFGGYTALAIAGATINFEELKQACERLYLGFDVALLLQCRALELPNKAYQLRDIRVTSAFALNPVNRFIFGEKGLANIKIPVLLASGSDDPAAPPALEQIASFTWLNTPNKYWMLIEGQAHVNFTQLDAGIQEALDSMVKLSLPSQNLISSYTNAMSVSFFEVYLQQNKDYKPYLSSAYAEYLSQNQQFKLDFITDASSDKVKKEIEVLKKQYRR